jgi:hypothetical protein
MIRGPHEMSGCDGQVSTVELAEVQNMPKQALRDAQLLWWNGHYLN